MAISNDYNFERWEEKFAKIGWILRRKIIENIDTFDGKNRTERLFLSYARAVDISEYLDKTTIAEFTYGSWEKSEIVKEKRDNLLLEIYYKICPAEFFPLEKRKFSRFEIMIIE